MKLSATDHDRVAAPHRFDAPRPQPFDIHISVWTIFKVALAVLAIFLIWKLWGVIVMVFVALALAALIDPFADWFEKRRIPRALAVIAIYVVLFGLLGLALVALIPPMLSELSELVKNFGGLWERAVGAFVNVQEVSAQYGVEQNIESALRSVEAGLSNAISGALGTIRGFFGGIVSFVIVLVLTFYMVVEQGAVRKALRAVAPPDYHHYLSGLSTRMQHKIGLWLRGELVLMMVVGVLSYIGLLILGVDYALVLALLAGFAEVIPYAGPIIASIPAVILAFAQEPVKALFVIVLYFAIQQLENNLLVPKIMQRAVGLNPVVSIVALLVGAKLAGILGVLLAIPVATALSVLFHDVFHEPEEAPTSV